MTPAEAAALRVVGLDDGQRQRGLQQGHDGAAEQHLAEAGRDSAAGPSGPWPMRVKAISISSGGPRVTRASSADRPTRPWPPGSCSRVERRGEVEPEHPGAAVGAEQLGGDEGAEHDDRGRDERVVVAVGRHEVRRWPAASSLMSTDRPTNTMAGT